MTKGESSRKYSQRSTKLFRAIEAILKITAFTLSETESYWKTKDLRMISSYLICKRIALAAVLEVAAGEGQKEEGDQESSAIFRERRDGLDWVDRARKVRFKIYFEGRANSLCGRLAGEILTIPQS